MRCFLYAVVLLCLAASHGEALRNFSISADGSTFLRDGDPVQVISGGFHYFRAVAKEWPQRFRTIAASGVNAVETYVAWNFHCPDGPDSCDFTGDRDLFRYVRLAQEHGLMVILRVGPYICAEWDLGGLPWWLLKGEKPMLLRTNNNQFLAAVRQWFDILLPKVVPYLFENGGPIVMVQVENEYGFISPVDKPYLENVRDMMRASLGENIILFSVDTGGYSDASNRTAIPGVFQTVDFYNDNVDPVSAWKIQHMFESVTGIKGPNMNSEYYVGWISYWGSDGVFSRNPLSVAINTRKLLSSSKTPVSLNMYQQFGGTNFGFWSGSNEVGYVPTSYDYGAPINQSGHPTPMFAALRDVFRDYLPNSALTSEIPQPPPLADYGTVELTEFAPLLGKGNLKSVAEDVVERFSSVPLSMENVGQGYGYIAYRFSVNRWVRDITLRPLDYALIYLDNEYHGSLVSASSGSTLQTLTLMKQRFTKQITIVVENLGRNNYGYGQPWDTQKGLISAPEITHIKNGQRLKFTPTSYTIYTLPMTLELVSNAEWTKVEEPEAKKADAPLSLGVGTFYRGYLNVSSTVRGGTMLDMREFGKGFVLVNGFNLGRHWSAKGPQHSLYCPESILKAGEMNEVIVFEQHKSFTKNGKPPQVNFTGVSYDVLDVEKPY